MGVMRGYRFLIDMHRDAIASYWVNLHVVGGAVGSLAFGEKPEAFPSWTEGELEPEFISLEDETSFFHQMGGFRASSFYGK